MVRRGLGVRDSQLESIWDTCQRLRGSLLVPIRWLLVPIGGLLVPIGRLLVPIRGLLVPIGREERVKWLAWVWLIIEQWLGRVRGLEGVMN
jgi:hypothetical protein